MKKNLSKKIMGIFAIATVSLSGITLASAKIITLHPYDYTIASTKSVNTDDTTFQHDNKRLSNKTTDYVTDNFYGGYLEVKIQKRGLFGIYSTKHTVRFDNPITDSFQEKDVYNDDPYRFNLYNYGIPSLSGELVLTDETRD